MIHKLLFVAFALAAGYAESTPSVVRNPDLSSYAPAPTVKAGRLEGWELHLYTSREKVVCVNPVIYAEARIVRCDGIEALEPLPEAQ